MVAHEALRLAPSPRQARVTSVARSGHHSTREKRLSSRRWPAMSKRGKLSPESFPRASNGDPSGIRTRAAALKGRCPRPG